MSNSTAQAFVLERIENDDGCRLPCWWGIIPGKTRWSEARNYLRSFAEKIVTISDLYLAGYLINEATFVVPSWISKDKKILQYYMTLDDNIVMVRTQVDPGMGYDIENLLKTYGTPAEIRLFTIPEPREGLLPFTLIFIYPNDGFLAIYRGEKAQYNNGMIKICPQSIGPKLWIWPSEQKLTFKDTVVLAGEVLTIDEVRYYLPIEKVINTSLEELYKVFKGESADKCFETTSDKWTWPSVP